MLMVPVEYIYISVVIGCVLGFAIGYDLMKH